jgi:cell division protein ZapB
MDLEVFDLLENRVGNLLQEFDALKRENSVLREDNQRLLQEREEFRTRLDSILRKLEGIGTL